MSTTTPQKSARVHTFHKTVGLSFPDTVQLYLTPAHARALARELKRFADGCDTGDYYATRIVKDGKARNESDGKKPPVTL